MSDSMKPTNADVIDVGEEQLARIYAKAFLGATASMDQEALVEELESLVADVLDKFPAFDLNLTGPSRSHEERLELIEGVLGGRASDPVINLLKVLSRQERNRSIRPVVRMIRKQYEEARGRQEVHVYVPRPLSGDLENELRQTLQSRLGVEANFFFHTNPDLLGGIVIQVGDTVFDGSVRTTLERTRQAMVVDAVDAIENRPEKFVSGKMETVA